MGFAPIKWTCTAFFRPRQLTDRAILANRQTQEKKSCVLVLVWFLRDFRRNGPIFRFTFSPAQWASPQLNGPVQRSSDRDS